MAQAIRVLRLAGHVSLGLAAMLLLAVLNEMLPSVMQGRLLRTSWCRWIVRVVLLQGVALFACSDPVWEIGQAFCPAIPCWAWCWPWGVLSCAAYARDRTPTPGPIRWRIRSSAP